MSKTKGALLLTAGAVIGYLAVRHGPALVRSVRPAIEDIFLEEGDEVGYHRQAAAYAAGVKLREGEAA